VFVSGPYFEYPTIKFSPREGQVEDDPSHSVLINHNMSAINNAYKEE
jgi:hypothetical protein